MTRFVPLFGCLLFAHTAFAQRPLNEIFDAGFMLEDRNRDGVIDFVNAETRPRVRAQSPRTNCKIAFFRILLDRMLDF